MITLSSCEAFGAVGVSVEAAGVDITATVISGGASLVGSVSDVKLRGNTITGGISALSGSPVRVWISDNAIASSTHGVRVETTASHWQIHNNIFQTISDDAVHLVGPTRMSIQGNQIVAPNDFGIYCEADDCDISGNLIDRPSVTATNADDGILLDGDRNYAHGNTVLPGSELPRYGINIAGGDCNVVVGNVLGNSADYGTDALNDTGTNTVLEYPTDPVYGSNIVDCGS
jgi:hypothetical protein